jgi:hypothetical protein
VTFNEVLSQTIAMLQQPGRVSYRALKRQFAIDDTFLEDLKYELIEVQQRAVDHDGTMLVWARDASAAATPIPPIALHRRTTPRHQTGVGTTGPHASTPGREDPYLPRRP